MKVRVKHLTHEPLLSGQIATVTNYDYLPFNEVSKRNPMLSITIDASGYETWCFWNDVEHLKEGISP